MGVDVRDHDRVETIARDDEATAGKTAQGWLSGAERDVVAVGLLRSGIGDGAPSIQPGEPAA
jgi:hypothetical protein